MMLVFVSVYNSFFHILKLYKVYFEAHRIQLLHSIRQPKAIHQILKFSSVKFPGENLKR